jgi:hypothetical protein
MEGNLGSGVESPYIVKFGVGDQLHASDTLSLGKEPLVPETDAVRTWWR